jgi:hypothetical protein
MQNVLLIGWLKTLGLSLALAGGVIGLPTLTTAEPGSITIVVVAAVPNTGLPAGTNQTGFDFSGTLGDFTVGINTPQEFLDLAPGTYTVIEKISAEWTLTGIYCDNGLALELPNPPQVTIDLQPGEAVSCTFANFANYDPPNMHQIFIPLVSNQGP